MKTRSVQPRGDGEEVIAAVSRHRPDVVVLDMEMPKMDGIETVAALRESCPKVRILIFTAFDTDDRIIDAVRAGIDGYLLKGVAREELFDAIRKIYAGETILQPAITTRLLARVGADSVDENPFTQREQEVLELLAMGLPNRELADVLSITERTVKFHVSSILEKLDVDNRTEAVSRAIQLRLIDI